MSIYLHQISVSLGGVPKLPLDRAIVTEDGLAGDKQRNRRYHGGPNRAVCLYSLDLIQALQAEGHPIQPGTAGENLTVAGLPHAVWSTCKKGTRFMIGDTVMLEVTAFAVPCKNIRNNFIDQVFTRLSQKLHPGWSRLYTKVIQPGTIQVHDAVTILNGDA